MDSESSSVDRLRGLAELQGVHPSDEDLDGVQSFLDAILPALAELETRFPPETPA